MTGPSALGGPVARIVLLVDDEALVLDNTADMLANLGCEVITASNGTEALAKLEADDRINILMTDVNMPGLGGFELAKIATRIRPGLQVILLSGLEAEGHGLPLIRKPFRECDITRVLSQTTGLC
jgi:two-component system, cell cycle response regulator CpdR